MKWRRSTLRRWAGGVALTAPLVLSLASRLEAFETLGISWSSNPRFRINPNFPDKDLSGTVEQQIEIISAAASAWTNQSAADFEFVLLGTSDRVGINTSDGINNISWVNADGGAAIAATLVDGIGNRATGFDLVFFGHTHGEENRWNGPRDPAPGTIDIGGVAVHEFGHALGLDHTPVRDATMFGSVRQLGLPARTLHDDDRSGIEFLYGAVAGRNLAPTIESVLPIFGPPAGDNEVVIRGANFTWKSDTTLRFDGDVVDSSRYELESLGLIRIARMPPRAEGFVDVTVENSSFGAGTLPRGYRYGPPPPAIEGIEPDLGPVSGGIEVTITGRSLRDGTEVFLGDSSLWNVRIIDTETLTGRVRATAAIGTVDITLVHDFGVSTLPQAFTYTSDILRIGEGWGVPGQSGVQIPVLASSERDLRAISFAFSYEPARVSIDDVTVAGTVAEGAPSTALDIDNEAGVTTFGFVMSLDSPVQCDSTEGPPALCAGEDIEVARIFATLSETNQLKDRIPIQMIESGGSPPVRPMFTPADGTLETQPFAFDGRVTVRDPQVFLRGDADSNDRLSLTDPIFHMAALFRGGPRSVCPDAADTNDDGVLDISDAVYSLNFQFLGGSAPPPPFPDPSVDPTEDELDCGL